MSGTVQRGVALAAALVLLVGGCSLASMAPRGCTPVTRSTSCPSLNTSSVGMPWIWKRLAGRDYPAMAVIGAVRLWDEECLVELDGIAVVD